MRLSLGLVGLAAAGLAAATSPSPPPRLTHETNDYYVLHLDANTSPQDVAQRLGLTHEGPLGPIDYHHIFSGPKVDADVVDTELKERKRRRRAFGSFDVLDGVRSSHKQVARRRLHKRTIPPAPAHLRQPLVLRATPDAATIKLQTDVMSTLGINDPIFKEQWHLINTEQVGHDVNVTGVWLQGITGKNATVAIVDDGLDMYSDDLKANYYAAGSWDFNDPGPEPRPKLSDDRHGTRCAGEVSAVRNDVCGVGVAYDSKIAGLRILSKLISDADEALAMVYDYEHNQIYSCSWGPPDDGRSMDAPGILIRQAMLKAIQQGRNGKGSIYVFASGNGAQSEDNCNFDGYTNSIYSITVGAIDRYGQHPYYSEKCSAQLVVTYSSGNGDAIHTTDVGQNSCYSGHGGTSAAAPLAAGIFALVLEIRPDLTWRDMQYLAMLTAVPINEDTEEWQTTKIGKKFSHTFGYGKVDSYGLVEAAKTWKIVKPQSWYFSPWVHVNQAIPKGNQGLKSTVEVTADELKKANLERVEHVTVTMNVNHGRRGDLSVDLISPEGIVSHIATTRKYDGATTGYQDWTFMSVAHWGESGIGTWTVIVKDSKQSADHNGTFIDWHFKLWGESIDPKKATLLPMPSVEDDNDHALIPTITATAATTAVTHPVETSVPGGDLPGHPSRPTKIQPSGSAQTGSPTAQPDAQTTGSGSSWVSWLPSFGASKSAQIWIYGALALIVVFCSGLGVYLFLARRRRLRNNPRDNYEFELLDDEEAERLNGGGAEKGAAGGAVGGKRRTRGGELYDAFAGGSDDEDDFADGGEYHDRVAAREEPQHVIGDDEDEDDEEDEVRDEKGRSKLLGS